MKTNPKATRVVSNCRSARKPWKSVRDTALARYHNYEIAFSRLPDRQSCWRRPPFITGMVLLVWLFRRDRRSSVCLFTALGLFRAAPRALYPVRRTLAQISLEWMRKQRWPWFPLSLPGLDPAIHLLRKNSDAKKMDHQNSGVPSSGPLDGRKSENIRFCGGQARGLTLRGGASTGLIRPRFALERPAGRVACGDGFRMSRRKRAAGGVRGAKTRNHLLHAQLDRNQRSRGPQSAQPNDIVVEAEKPGNLQQFLSCDVEDKGSDA